MIGQKNASFIGAGLCDEELTYVEKEVVQL